MITKKIVSFLLALMIIPMCYAKPLSKDYNYNIAGVAIAQEGYYLVEISAIVDKKKKATIELAKKCAIHGCLFKGFSVDNIAQKPMVISPSVEDENPDFFNKLFEEQYKRYTNCTHPIQIVKVGKQYRVTAIVLVSKELLRKDLESAGIIRKLGL